VVLVLATVKGNMPTSLGMHINMSFPFVIYFNVHSLQMQIRGCVQSFWTELITKYLLTTVNTRKATQGYGGKTL